MVSTVASVSLEQGRLVESGENDPVLTSTEAYALEYAINWLGRRDLHERLRPDGNGSAHVVVDRGEEADDQSVVIVKERDGSYSVTFGKYAHELGRTVPFSPSTVIGQQIKDAQIFRSDNPSVTADQIVRLQEDATVSRRRMQEWLAREERFPMGRSRRASVRHSTVPRGSADRGAVPEHERPDYMF